MPEIVPDNELGRRVRWIRRRRGLTVEQAAGLAGISKGFLSMLERGQRSFTRRGLIEALAEALGCSPADITGRMLPADGASAEAMASLLPISAALLDCTMTDVPGDVSPRPVATLAILAGTANAHSSAGIYSLAGRDLGDLITELHVHLVNDSAQRTTTLRALAETCMVAAGQGRTFGNLDLAIHAARRAQATAAELGDPAFAGFAAMTTATLLSRLGARHRATATTTTALSALAEADPSAEDTAPAEAAGMLHLSSAQTAAKSGNPVAARDHLAAATELAERTGERTTLQFSFGPSNCRAWSLSIAVELGDGPSVAEQLEAVPDWSAGLPAERRSAAHFDLARAWSQADGARDTEAIRHFDLADRIAPQRVRADPLSRELLNELRHRARHRAWELDSLRNRLAVR